MKKRIVAVLLSAAMIFTMAPVSPVSAAPEDGDNSVPAVQVDAENPGNNIALKATADASYTNTYGISPASMNDGSWRQAIRIRAGTAGARMTSPIR